MVKASTIKAHGPWVLIKVDPHPETSKGGIYLPQGNMEEVKGHSTGEVLSVGPGYFNKSLKGSAPKEKFCPLDLRVGDRVMFRGYLHDVNKYHQDIEGLEHSLVHCDNIEGVLEK